MAVVKDLRRIDYILDKLKEHPDVVKITGWNRWSIEAFQDGLRRAIRRYEKDTARVKKHYIGH